MSSGNSVAKKKLVFVIWGISSLLSCLTVAASENPQQFDDQILKDISKLAHRQSREKYILVSQRISLLRYLPERQHLVQQLARALSQGRSLDSETRVLYIRAIGEIGSWDDRQVLLELLRDRDEKVCLATADALASVCLDFAWSNSPDREDPALARRYWLKWNEGFGRMAYSLYVRTRYQQMGAIEEKQFFLNFVVERPLEDALRGIQVVGEIEDSSDRIGWIIVQAELFSGLDFSRGRDAGRSEFLAWCKTPIDSRKVINQYATGLGMTTPCDREQYKRLICGLFASQRRLRLYSQILLSRQESLIDPYGLILSQEDRFEDAPVGYVLHQVRVAEFWSDRVLRRKITEAPRASPPKSAN